MWMTTCTESAGNPDITGLLRQWGRGDGDALGQLMTEVYDQLRRLAHRALRGERRDHTFQTTELIHEAFLRFAAMSEPDWGDRRHFYAVAARLMRFTLVDHARSLRADRRGGGWHKVTLEDPEGVGRSPVDLLALDQALRQLAEMDARKVRVIEMRFFSGLSVEETAEILGVSKPTVVLDTRLARAWLYSRIRNSGAGDHAGAG